MYTLIFVAYVVVGSTENTSLQVIQLGTYPNAGECQNALTTFNPNDPKSYMNIASPVGSELKRQVMCVPHGK